MGKEKNVKTIQKIALIIGVLIIPLMYSFFYLKAFWDPYQRLNKVPVAVVNQDEGAVINGENRNLGKEIENDLKEDKTLDFQFTDEQAAKKGVKGNKYYASITIPEDFSACAATAGEDTEKLHGTILYRANQKRNYLAAQILENAMPAMKEKINSEIDKQLVGTLADTVKEVPDQLDELSDGLTQLDDGAGKLQNGTSQLAAGAGALSNGISTLNGKVPALEKGAGALNSGAGQLAAGMKKLTKNNKALNNGAGQLADGADSLNTGLFAYTEGVAQAGGGASQLKSGIKAYTDGVSKANTGAGTLKSGIKTYTDGVSKAGSGASALESGLKDYTAGVDKAAEGAAQVSSGLSQVAGGLNEMETKVSGAASSLGELSSGARDLASGISDFQTAYNQAYQLLQAGQTERAMMVLSQLKGKLPDMKTGADRLSGGIDQFASGMQDLSGGISQLQGAVGKNGKITKGAGSLSAGLSVLQSKNDELNGGADQLSSGLKELGAGSSALNTGAAQLSSGLDTLSANSTQLNSGASALSGGLDTLKGNNDQLTGGAASLADGSDQLKNGIAAYTKGAGSAQSGASKLAAGTKKLTAGLPALASGVGRLDSGAAQLAAGAGTLDSGAGRLKNGLDLASNGVSTAVDKANSEAGRLDGLSDYAAKPVDTKTEYVQPVANYGSAFGPYFMGLSLWVGSLLIFFGLYFDYNRRIRALIRESQRYLIRTLAFALISVGQGILLAFVIKSVLHISVNHPLMLYAGSILTALTFTAIIQFCIINLGDIGKFLAMLLLILQLTSCAGTFPIETQNAFFRAINPILPMTYSTQLFKEAISGTIGSNYTHSALILAAFAAGFLALTIILSARTRKLDLHRVSGEAGAAAS